VRDKNGRRSFFCGTYDLTNRILSKGNSAGDESIDALYIDIINRTLSSTDVEDIAEAEIIDANQEEYLLLTNLRDQENRLDVFLVPMEFIDPAVSHSSSVKKVEQVFYDILESIHDDFVIINKNGVIEKVLPNFQEMYGISAEEAVGKTVYEMEERKIFNPSIAIRVMKSKKRETILQLTGANKYLMCTAIPIMDKEGNIQRIISYTRDMTKYEALKKEYSNLEQTLAAYSTQLGQLREERKENSKIIGSSTAIRNVIDTIDKVAKFDANVLLTGESGVGKTLFAEAIHSASGRQDAPFITINCGAIPENLLESELFGYEKGAFTGASNEGKPGLIELSHKGVLFLDEIGDLPLHMQVKLLKVIQDKKVTRVGGVKEKQVDFRLIAASNKDILELINQDKFREDLYYRINVISIQIPPLRERPEDVFPLATHFLERFGEKYEVKHILNNTAMSYLEQYSWPGNARELANVIERLVITEEEYVITENNLPTHIYNRKNIPEYDIKDRTLKSILEEVEKDVLIRSYREHGTTMAVAKALGISQPSASVKLSKYLKGKKEEK
jgi:PAS domain S-box-containing protein